MTEPKNSVSPCDLSVVASLMGSEATMFKPLSFDKDAEDQLLEAIKNDPCGRGVDEGVLRRDFGIASGYTPLICGAIRNNTEAIKILLAAGADVNAKDQSGKKASGKKASGKKASRLKTPDPPVLASNCSFEESPAPSMTDAEIEALIAERGKARVERNFKRSDEIRSELQKAGVSLQDHVSGETTWERV